MACRRYSQCKSFFFFQLGWKTPLFSDEPPLAGIVSATVTRNKKRQKRKKAEPCGTICVDDKKKSSNLTTLEKKGTRTRDVGACARKRGSPADGAVPNYKTITKQLQDHSKKHSKKKDFTWAAPANSGKMQTHMIGLNVGLFIFRAACLWVAADRRGVLVLLFALTLQKRAHTTDPSFFYFVHGPYSQGWPR